MERRRATRQEPLATPLLDRLLNPGTAAGAGDGSRAVNSVRTVRDAIQRDLESLLNTRWRCRSFPPTHEELEKSLVNYGIPDFTGASFVNPVTQRDFRQIIARAIAHFEPRLHAPKVIPVTQKNKSAGDETRTLRFRIEATLLSEEGRQNVAYETQMNPADTTFTVRRAGR
ncbi:type VI secretion system baseplate subunit TssE [Phycisphaeraceae bacterium D3-23]